MDDANIFQTFCRVEGTNTLQGECCKYFADWMLQIFCRAEAANILRSGEGVAG